MSALRDLNVSVFTRNGFDLWANELVRFGIVTGNGRNSAAALISAATQFGFIATRTFPGSHREPQNEPSLPGFEPSSPAGFLTPAGQRIVGAYRSGNQRQLSSAWLNTLAVYQIPSPLEPGDVHVFRPFVHALNVLLWCEENLDKYQFAVAVLRTTSSSSRDLIVRLAARAKEHPEQVLLSAAESDLLPETPGLFPDDTRRKRTSTRAATYLAYANTTGRYLAATGLVLFTDGVLRLTDPKKAERIVRSVGPIRDLSSYLRVLTDPPSLTARTSTRHRSTTDP